MGLPLASDHTLVMAPSTMQAWVFKKSGLPSDVLHLEPAWPVPIPGRGELLVKVNAAALNRELA